MQPNSKFVDVMQYIAREWREWLLRPDLAFLSVTGFAKLSAVNTSAQSIPNNAVTTVTNWTETFDAANNFVPTTGIFTATTPGFYEVDFAVSFAGALGIANPVIPVILLNGVATAQSNNLGTATAAFNTVSIKTVVKLVVGNTLAAAIYQNSGGAQLLNASALYNRLSIMQLA